MGTAALRSEGEPFLMAASLLNSAAFQSPDTKKEEFRRYLERSGVIDALTKVLVGLYEEPEKPANALDFIKMTLGAPTGVDVDQLKAENEQLRKQCGELTLGLENVQAKLAEAEAKTAWDNVFPRGAVTDNVSAV